MIGQVGKLLFNFWALSDPNFYDKFASVNLLKQDFQGIFYNKPACEDWPSRKTPF